MSIEELQQLSKWQEAQFAMHKVSKTPLHNSQNQMTTAQLKEDRLQTLINYYHRQEQKLDSLKHLRTSQQAQEQRLQDLRALKSQLELQNSAKAQLSKCTQPSLTTGHSCHCVALFWL